MRQQCHASAARQGYRYPSCVTICFQEHDIPAPRYALTNNFHPVLLYREYMILAVPAAARQADSRIPRGKLLKRSCGVALPRRAPNEGPEASCASDMQTDH